MPTLKIKRPNDSKEVQNGNSPPNKIRRIHPLKIGEVRGNFKNNDDDDKNDDENELDLSSQGSSKLFKTLGPFVVPKSDVKPESQSDQSQEEPSTSTNQEEKQKKHNEETEELKRFIKACRKAESSDDMKKIIKKKLLKKYHLVSSSYVLSNHFKKLLNDTANDILRDPKRVYSKIQDIVNELGARKQKNEVVPVIEVASSSQDSQQSTSEENGLHLESTGDIKKDSHLRKLNRALVTLKHKITDLEEAEVNLDDDEDSAYLQKVRYEKRAIEIYNKICELTGESTHAYRIVKKPIRFKESKYKEFNRGLTKKINKENGFPTYFDVYRLLDFCNKEYKYQLAKCQVEDEARSSFSTVGKQNLMYN